MPNDPEIPGVVSEKIEGIPLFLIPKIVADQIRKMGDAVFQILVERKFHHKYTVNVETLNEHTQRVNQEEPSQEEGDGHG